MEHTGPASFAFSDDCMFNRVMSEPSICRRVIERILGTPVRSIVYRNTQQEIETGVFARGVRLDVYVESEEAVYDVEIQSRREPHLARRLRYYQAMIDAGTLAKGEDYDELPESYVIFLCTTDPLGRGLPVYTIERACLEDPGCEVACGSHWIALNASAWDRAEDPGIRDLLQYVHSGEVPEGDALVGDIASAVWSANHDRRWVDDMIWSVSTIQEDLERRVRIAQRDAERAKKAALVEGRAEGIAQGMAQGKAQEAARYNALVLKLSSEGRLEELARAAEDPALMEALFSELQ